MARSGFKMKGNPMRRNFPSAFKSDKPTEAELIAQAEAQFGEGVKVSGGKKTEQGSFVQDDRGSSIAGSSIIHHELRKKEKKGTLTRDEKSQLKTLNQKTGKAWRKKVSGEPGQKTAKKEVARDAEAK